MPTHPDADAFLRRLILQPDDAVMRQVFADWLDEQGGVGAENWARYIRLRTEAAIRTGLDRELLIEDAANVAPLIRARLTVPAAKIAPHFPAFVDLLPPGQYVVALRGFALPTAPNAALGEAVCRRSRCVVLAERDDVVAILTDRTGSGPVGEVRKRLTRPVLAFQTPDLNAALDQLFPPAAPSAPPAATPLSDLSATELAHRVLAEACGMLATAIEVVAYPMRYEVRYVVGGHTSSRHILTNASGAKLVSRLYDMADADGSGMTATPRNTSFGDGVHLDITPP